MNLYTFFLPSIIFITLIILVINRNKLKPDYNKNFIIYVAISFLVEAIAHIITVYKGTNIQLYNIQMIFEISFFCYIFLKANEKKNIKNIVLAIISFFLIFALINIFFYQTINNFNTYTYTLGSFFLSLLCLKFLFDVIVNGNSINPFQIFLFWVCIGILFCYLGNLPYLISLNVLFNNHHSIVRKLSIISKVVNTLLFILIIIGTLCQKKISK